MSFLVTYILHAGPRYLMVFIGLAFFVLPAMAQDKSLSPRAKAHDANGNNLIERSEAGGPLAANFDTMDCDKSGALDGAEIRGFFTGAGCQKAAKPSAVKSTKPKAGRPPPNVQVDAVVKQSVGQTFPIIGRLISRQSGAIAAVVAGAVKEMRVNVGDRLKPNQVIAVLDSDRLIAERDRWAAIVAQRSAMVDTARAQLGKTRQEERRIKDLQASAAFSRARMEDVTQDVAARKGSLVEREAQLAEARVQLRRRNLDLADAIVRAPFGGVVTEKHIDVGSYMKVGDRIITLLNDNDIEVEAEIPTDQIYGLKPGTNVQVVLDDNTVHEAFVRAIIPQENPRTRTRSVRFMPRFGTVRKSLATDQSVTVRIPLNAKAVITVHKDAIVRRGGKAIVFVVQDNRAMKRLVKLGRGVGVRFIVTKGLKAGDVVIVRGNERLGGGGPVKIINKSSVKLN